jgi:hypothetical protein
VRRIRHALDRLRTRFRDEVDRHAEEGVDPGNILADVILTVTFAAIGAFGLVATLTTPRHGLLAALGAVGVVGIEVMMMYFALIHGLATRRVYRRSEPTVEHGETVDAYEMEDG